MVVINANTPPNTKGVDCPMVSHKTPAIIDAGNNPNPIIAECKPSALAFCFHIYRQLCRKIIL
jgi:hypothetical protein